MKIRSILLSSAIASLTTIGLGAIAQADTTDAHCDLYAPGEDYAYLSSNCTFSQRQGHIGIHLQNNGVRYEFDPVGNTPGNFLDQYGQAVYRQSGLGDAGQIFEFVDGSHLYVYWDNSASYGSVPVSDARMATLTAHDRGSQINVRSEPTIYSYAHSYGLTGDQVRILQCVPDEDTGGSTLNWCEVQFIESGLVGWIRNDFILFSGEGYL